jgi:hypothetical protein
MPNMFEIIGILFAPRNNKQNDVCKAEQKKGTFKYSMFLSRNFKATVYLSGERRVDKLKNVIKI